MSLPRIDVPSYTCMLPSTGQQLQFRPFLVKEQKQLLIAMGGDELERFNTVKAVVTVCFENNKLDVDALSSADLEYLFLQLRIRYAAKPPVARICSSSSYFFFSRPFIAPAARPIIWFC